MSEDAIIAICMAAVFVSAIACVTLVSIFNAKHNPQEFSDNYEPMQTPLYKSSTTTYSPQEEDKKQ